MKLDKVVCIYPYLQEVPIYEFFPPIGLEYIAAAIEDLVGEVSVIDLRLEKNFGDVLKVPPDMFCVSVNWHYEFESVCEVIRALPPEVLTVVGGRQATESVDQLFELCPNIDVIVRGDGEETIREFVTTGSPEGVAGLSYRQNGRVVHNPNRDLKPVSNTLFPNREARRYQYRVSYQKVGLGYSFDSMFSSRGCPFNCKFCSFKRNPLGQKREYSERTPESVIEELRQIEADVVGFLDDNFFVNIERVNAICDLILEEKIRKKFIVNARISIAVHPELLKKMYRAGFWLLMIGVESAQDKSLKSLSKGFTTDEARKAFAVLSRTGMLTSGYFIVGLIGETEEDMLEIGPFATELGLDLIHLNRLRFEKYSGIGDMLAEHPEYYVGEGSRIYSKDLGPREINSILKRIRNGFFTPGKIARALFKGLCAGFPGWKFLLRLPFILPIVIARIARRKQRCRAAREKLRLTLGLLGAGVHDHGKQVPPGPSLAPSGSSPTASREAPPR